jgi:hypothetical protein
MEDALAASTLRELRALAAIVAASPSTSNRPAPNQDSSDVRSLLAALPVRVYKGGGYRADDLAAVLKSARLTAVIAPQLHLRGAQCVLACPRWSPFHRPANLKQVSTDSLV